MRFLVSIFLLSLATLSASAAIKPVTSPLNTPPDAIGNELRASFIGTPPETDIDRGGFVAFRRTFKIDSPPTSAVLHLFADARYLVWLNGVCVSRGPNRFDILGPEYDSIDLTRRLRAGDNTFAIVVMSNSGDVKAKNDGMGQGHNARMMRHVSGLTLRLDFNGRTALRSDESWKWSNQTRYRTAKIDWAKIVDVIDTRVENGVWTLPTYDDRAWKPAKKIDGSLWGPLVASRTPPLRDTPVDFQIKGDAKFPITLKAGEKLTLSTSRLVLAYTVLDFEASADASFRLDYAGVDYTARAGRQTYISSDTCANTGGTITVKTGEVTIHDLRLIERLYPFDLIGSFHSSDPFLNRLWAMCARSLQILSEDSYTDCADRERAEWMDNDPPAFDITRTAFAGPGGNPHYADARLLGALLRRTALSVQPEGWVKAHTTSDRFDIHAHMEDRSCNWVQGARRYYESTGDATFIREIWPVVVRQLDYFLMRRTERGLVRAREWVVWGNPVGYVTGEGTGLNAYVCKALADAAVLGRVIGESKDAARFSNEATALARAINIVLWNETVGTYYSGHITPADLESAKADKRASKMPLAVENNLIASSPYAALWALDQEIVPADRRARVTSYMLSHREELQRDHVMPYYYLFKQLYAADTDAFDREILQTLRTKWKPMAEFGWQTSWEAISMSPQFKGSRAHIYGMFPGYFLSSYVLGVRPVVPASARCLLIEPRLGDLASAAGTVVTEAGPVAVSWMRKEGALRFQIEIPAGATATLRVPAPAPDGKLVVNGRPAATRESGRYIETSLDAGLHEGLVSKLP
jgi:hypothetical protein